MKYHLVYCTTNLVNGKQYVGIHSTNDKDDGYLGSGTLFKEAIEKHGEENFSREILFECKNRKEILWLEKIIVSQWLVDKWGNGKYFYNKMIGGFCTFQDKKPVKSLDMYGQIRHYESVTSTSKIHNGILSGINTGAIRYGCLWKWEEDNSEWVWPEYIMNFGNRKIEKRKTKRQNIKEDSKEYVKKCKPIKNNVNKKIRISKKDKEYEKLERMKERARKRRVREIRKMEEKCRKRLEKIAKLEQQLEEMREQEREKQRQLLPVYGPHPRLPDWLLIIQNSGS